MNVKEVHNELKSFNSTSPIIALTAKLWKSQVEIFSKDYFGKLAGSMMQTPLKGLFADFQVLGNGAIVEFEYEKLNDIQIKEYKIEFTLKTELSLNSPEKYISRHVIAFKTIKFGISNKAGNAYLEKIDERYLAYPPRLATEEERNLQFEYLKNKHDWDNDQIEYFTCYQESSAGFLAASGLMEQLSKPFKIIDFHTMFPKFKFAGDFDIKLIDLDINNDENDNDKLICFIPEEYELKEPTQCEIDQQRDRTIVTGDYDGNNGEITVGGGTYTSATVGKTPRPRDSKTSEIFIYLPHTTNENLFRLTNNSKRQHVNEKNNKALHQIAKSSDSWEIPPFLLSHSAKLYAEDQVNFTWSGIQPVINLKIGIYLDFYLKLWMKVFRIKTHIGTVDSKNQYEIKYNGKLVEFYNGDLGFVGELWDPSNFTIKNLELDTILPDFVDRVASKIIKVVLEPIIRYLLTKLVISVTWPFISKYILYGLAGGSEPSSSSLVNNIRHPNKVPMIELSNYHADPDQKSMTIGINRKIRNIEGE